MLASNTDAFSREGGSLQSGPSKHRPCTRSAVALNSLGSMQLSAGNQSSEAHVRSNTSPVSQGAKLCSWCEVAVPVSARVRWGTFVEPSQIIKHQVTTECWVSAPHCYLLLNNRL